MDMDDGGTGKDMGTHGGTQGRGWCGDTERCGDMDGPGDTQRDKYGDVEGCGDTQRGTDVGTWTLMDMEGDTEGQRWDMDGHGDAYTWMMWRQGRTWGHTEGHMDVDGVGTQWTRGTHRQRDMD